MESARSELPLFELVVGADKVSVFTRFVRLVLFLLGRSIPYSDARCLARYLAYQGKSPADCCSHSSLPLTGPGNAPVLPFVPSRSRACFV
jgi:hypothetical protein